MQVHVGPSMEKVELSSDLKFLSKIQIEWFKVLQIDQDLVRSDFVELNQELGNEFLNKTSWGMFGLYYGDNRERQLLSCDTLIPLLDASNSGEEEEVELDKDFIYIVGILILMELKKYRDK
ncbi:uncharacterized protein [Lolium perenne]|uniref:uncharacterized protein isoform X1 n=2 Tax=Lolium perenne TaxID=4522 RepID=UPI0021F50E8C|nr:uncharacterized protein LOC127342781 isoform X1 [Lolium perenne]